MRISIPIFRMGGIASLPIWWLQAYFVSKLDQKPNTTGEKIAAVVVPSWYSSFKVAKLTPTNTPKNYFWHTLGKVLIPDFYTAFQLAQMKSPKNNAGEKALGFLLGPLYNIYASSVLSERSLSASRSTQLSVQQPFQAISAVPSTPLQQSLRMPTPPYCNQQLMNYGSMPASRSTFPVIRPY